MRLKQKYIYGYNYNSISNNYTWDSDVILNKQSKLIFTKHGPRYNVEDYNTIHKFNCKYFCYNIKRFSRWLYLINDNVYFICG